MAALKDSAFELATGDPIYCEGCKGIFNFFSQIVAEGKWQCEFCNHLNSVEVDVEERPKKDTVNYIVEAAPIKATASVTGT